MNIENSFKILQNFPFPYLIIKLANVSSDILRIKTPHKGIVDIEWRDSHNNFVEVKIKLNNLKIEGILYLIEDWNNKNK